MRQGVEVAERQIIAHLIQNPEDLYQISSSDFITDIAKDVYTSLAALAEQGVHVTPQTLSVQLSLRNNHGILDTQLAPFWEVANTPGDLAFFKKELARANALLEAQQTILKPLIEKGLDQQKFDIGIYRETEEKLRAFRSKIEESNQKYVYTAEEVVNLYRKELDQRSSLSGFYTSGCSYLDKHVTMGFAPGTISTIFGPTGSGKTTLGLGYFMRQVNKGIPAVYFTLEMTLGMLMDRLFAMRSLIDISNLYPHLSDDGRIPKGIFDQYEKFAESFSKAKHVRLVDQNPMSIADVDKYVGEIKRELKVDYLSVYIDLFSMLKEFTKAGRLSTADNIEACMNEQHAIAKKHKVHFMNIVQANRDADATRPRDIDDLDKLRPRLRNIKSSHAIAERSRLVIGVFRPKVYAEEFFPDSPLAKDMLDVLHAIILKQNQGELGELTYIFHGAQSRLVKYVPPSSEHPSQESSLNDSFLQP